MNIVGAGKTKLIPILVLLIIIVNIIAQLIYFRPFMDNQPLSLYLPTPDAIDYITRANLLADGFKFSEAFQDVYRLPGYALFISLFYLVSDTPLLLARYTQILLSSLCVGIAYLTLMNILGSGFWSFIGCLLVATWFPFYYYSPVIVCETTSIFFVCLFCFVMARYNQHSNKLTLVWCAVCLAALVYLKPNHIILCLPCMVFVYYVNTSPSLLGRILPSMAVLVIVGILILPWTIFASMKTGTFVPLATNAGINRYMNTGQLPPYDASAEGSLQNKIANYFKLVRKDRSDQIAVQGATLSPSQLDKLYGFYALQGFMERPFHVFLYSFAGVAHTFGFSLRNLQDALVLMHFIVSLLASLYLWKSGNYREWCLFLWSVFAVVVLQSFFLNPSQRFKCILYDYPSLIVMTLALSVWATNTRIFGKKWLN